MASPLNFLRHSLSLNLEVTDSARIPDCWALGILLSVNLHYPHPLGLQIWAIMSSFYVAAGDPNSGLCVCAASTSQALDFISFAEISMMGVLSTGRLMCAENYSLHRLTLLLMPDALWFSFHCRWSPSPLECLQWALMILKSSRMEKPLPGESLLMPFTWMPMKSVMLILRSSWTQLATWQR